MPIIKGFSKRAIGKNITTEMKKHPQAQAVAIALSIAAKAKAAKAKANKK